MRVLVATQKGQNDNKSLFLNKTLETNKFSVDIVDLHDDVHEYARSAIFQALIIEADAKNWMAIDVIKKIRALRLDIPIIVIAENANGHDRAKMINLGADDVMTLPFLPAEMLARLYAVIRRSAGTADQILRCGQISMNLMTREMKINEKPVKLTGREFAILNMLLTRRGMLIKKETFIEHIYNGIDEPNTKIIDVYICKLRRKIIQNGGGDIIKTVWGAGYQIENPRSSSSETENKNKMNILGLKKSTIENQNVVDVGNIANDFNINVKTNAKTNAKTNGASTGKIFKEAYAR